MFESNLVDLDELVLMVRDRNSRAYIGEAVTTYRVRCIPLGTPRHVDRGRLRHHLQGPRTECTRGCHCRAFITVLDNAIDANNRGDPDGLKRLQIIENELLDKALRDFEFLVVQEHKDLERLRNDRNLCAHPAFTNDLTLFQPSAELVRAHIAQRVSTSAHPPVQGKHALNG